MAVTNATSLADYASGIGTQGATLEVDATNKRVGINSESPDTTLDVHGTLQVLNANIVGVVTASEIGDASSVIYGDGSNLSGVSGFGTALSSTAGDFLNVVYQTPYSQTLGAGTSIKVSSNSASGDTAFTRLGQIIVATGATFHIGAGTTLVMDVLRIFN